MPHYVDLLVGSWGLVYLRTWEWNLFFINWNRITFQTDHFVIVSKRSFNIYYERWYCVPTLVTPKITYLICLVEGGRIHTLCTQMYKCWWRGSTKEYFCTCPATFFVVLICLPPCFQAVVDRWMPTLITCLTPCWTKDLRSVMSSHLFN